MRIAFVALALVAVAIVYLELQLAEGKMRLKVPKVRLKGGGTKIRVPKIKKTRIHAPKMRHVGKALAHGAAGTVNVVTQLGSTGAAIAQTALSNKNKMDESSSD